MSLSQNRPARLLAAAAALAAGAIGTSHALAQCDVYRPGLPDFDQRREAAPGILGLPNNGSMHCVPTSAADAVAYAANHGAPQLTQNTIWNWASPATYNVATNLINTLGTLMGTNEDGTNSAGYVNGMNAFINARAPGQFIVGSVGWSNGNPPSPEQIHDIISAGGFALAVRGTYSPEPNNPNILTRTGGHILLVRNIYDACSDFPRIGMRDPNSSDSKFVNAPWGVYREQMHEFTATYRLNGGGTQQRNYWRWTNDYGQNRKVLDGILTFIPTFALTGPVIHGTEAGINVVRPMTLTGPVPAPTHNQFIPLPQGADPVTSLEILPNNTGVVVFTGAHGSGGGGGTGKAHFGDLRATAMVLRDGPEFLSPIVDSCTSPDGLIYACESGQMNVLAMQDGSVRLISSTTVAGPIQACGYDDAGNRTVVITRSSASAQPHIKVFDGRTGRLVTDAPCPSQVVFEGNVGVCIDPADGSLLCCSDGRDVIYRLGITPTGTVTFFESIPLPAGSAPRNPQVDGAGIYYTGLEGVTELRRNATGGWDVVANGPFSGFTFGSSFSLATSRDGISATELTGPVTTNIEDEILSSATDCPADFNDDGMVNSQDFFDFLQAFFNQAPRADFNDNGAINSQDFFDFLAAFFRGC